MVIGNVFNTDLVIFEMEINSSEVCIDYENPWLKKACISLAEAFRLAAVDILDVDFGELCVGSRRRFSDGKAHVDIYLFDSLSSGAGYSSMLANGAAIENVIKRARNILSECDCEASCLNCLRHYGNKMYHTSLDRYAALDLLDYITRNEVRRLPRKSGLKLFGPLVEALTQERGISCDVGEDLMQAWARKSSVSVRVIPNPANKDRNCRELQLWESEIEHNLPNAFATILDALDL